MKREIIRVEPLSTYLEKWKAPTSVVVRSGETIYVSGLPPFDPVTGEVIDAPIERQTELVVRAVYGDTTAEEVKRIRALMLVEIVLVDNHGDERLLDPITGTK